MRELRATRSSQRNWSVHFSIPAVSQRTKREPGVWARPPISPRVICRPQFNRQSKDVSSDTGEAREILSIASVIGKAFDSRDLEALAGAKDVEDAIDRLVDEGLLEEERESRGDRLTFSSGVVRDVLYGSISRRKRRSLHRKYAEEVEKRHGGRLERVYPHCPPLSRDPGQAVSMGCAWPGPRLMLSFPKGSSRCENSTGVSRESCRATLH